MRIVLRNYGDVRIEVDRPYGYKRFIVFWPDHTEMFSGLWYKQKKVLELVESRL